MDNPITENLPILTPKPPEPLNEQEEEHQHYIKMCEAMDSLPIYPPALTTNDPGMPMALGATAPSFEKDKALIPEPITVEYSLAELTSEQELTRPSTPARQPIQTAPAPTSPSEQGSLLPKITRHKGQRTQTFKAIYTVTPIQYRTALDRLRDLTRKSIKEVLCEAIGDMAVKHGLASSAGAIMGWADWD